MSSLLVTGGAGFIGANFVRYWRQTHASDAIVVLDSLTYAGNLASLDSIAGVDFIHGNICDFDRILRLLTEREIDLLVHFAAESHVDRSIHAPDAFIETNIVGTHTLLKAAKVAWLDAGGGRPHHFHHVSTDEVFGSLAPDAPAFSETSQYRPNSPYSASKAASDHVVRAYHHTYGLCATTSNCSNNYGPYQFPEKLIPLFIINALLGKPLPIYGDGGNVRDWLHVVDHCRGIDLILANGIPGETYNIGGGSELPNLGVVERICAAVDAEFAIHPALSRRFPDAPAGRGGRSADLKTHVADRKGHDRRYAIDESKMRQELGYTPAYQFDKGLRDTVHWYLENEEWWRTVMDGSYRQWVQRHYKI
jgi:dTDP-glucose 4,6-dehydratase